MSQTPSTTSSTASLTTLMKSLCDEASVVSNNMCSMLSKSEFNSIIVSDICGKGKTKVPKEFLAQNLINVLKLTNSINESINPVFSCSTLSDNLNNICDTNFNNQITSDIKAQLDTSATIKEAVTESMKEHWQFTERMLRECQSIVSNLNNNTPQQPPLHQPCPTQDTHRTVPDIEAPEPALSNIREDFLSIDDEKMLMDFLSGLEYSNENGHSVKNFGAKYHYRGAADGNGDDKFPAELDTVVEKLKTFYPDINFNECLLNKYDGAGSFLSEHSDDEPCIDPESSIVTVSIGQSRTITFRNKFNNETLSTVAKGRSIYTMTKSSQDYYTHQIKQESDSTLRYSLTFRNVGPQFRKSTIVIGDSNAKFLSFGEGKGTFGRGCPGKVMKASRVADVNPHDCMGYNNIVLLVGTNDLREKFISDRGDIIRVVDTLREKVDTIRQLRRNAKIVLLPVLPTRYSNMNRGIQCYNDMLYEHFILSRQYFNVVMTGVREYFDDEYLLRKELVRSNDATHLNHYGVARVACTILSAIHNRPYRERTDVRLYSSVTKAQGGMAGAT